MMYPAFVTSARFEPVILHPSNSADSRFAYLNEQLRNAQRRIFPPIRVKSNEHRSNTAPSSLVSRKDSELKRQSEKR